jgi:DNA-binding CsgD family transcriptional regulator
MEKWGLIDPRVFSDIIGAIYDCAVDPSGWSDTLQQFTDEVNFHNSSLSLMSLPTGSFTINETSGISDEWKSRMSLYSSDIVDLWGGADKMWSYPFDRPSVLSRVNPTGYASNNRYMREWRDPQGLLDVAVAILAHDADCIGNIGIGRHRDQGPIEDIDLDRVSLFIPHFRRAVRIGWMLGAQPVTDGCFEEVVDRLITPVMLVDRDLKILHANRSAADMLDNAQVVTRFDGRLQVPSAVAMNAIRHIVAQANDDEANMRSGAIGLPSVGKSFSMHSLHVMPLQRGISRPALHRGAAAAIFISSTQVARSRLGEVMRMLFDLTGAEARVFERLASGETSQQAASSLGTAPSTVKTHLLRIFDKTGVRRQSDLIQLAAALAPPIREEAGPEAKQLVQM